MRVLYALICESAEARDDGRMDVHGVFHHLFAPGFPAQQDRLVLAVALEWAEGEEGRTPFRIDLLEPTGSPILTISGHTDVGSRREREPPPRTLLIMPMDEVVFPAPGLFEFELHAREQKLRIAPLHLIEDPDAR